MREFFDIGCNWTVDEAPVVRPAVSRSIAGRTVRENAGVATQRTARRTEKPRANRHRRRTWKMFLLTGLPPRNFGRTFSGRDII